jgi:hypothetical protein
VVHDNEGYRAEDARRTIFGPPVATRYGIVSFATSF